MNMNKEALFIYEEDGFCELKYTYGDLCKLFVENNQLKEFNDKQKKIALELINFALKSDVDYVYVLEDLEKILNGEKTKWNKEHYWN